MIYEKKNDKKWRFPPDSDEIFNPLVFQKNGTNLIHLFSLFPFSCRSTKMEEHLFWKFEGTVLALTVVFAIVVVARQRSLDRKASDKVRRQIESI